MRSVTLSIFRCFSAPSNLPKLSRLSRSLVTLSLTLFVTLPFVLCAHLSLSSAQEEITTAQGEIIKAQHADTNLISETLSHQMPGATQSLLGSESWRWVMFAISILFLFALRAIFIKLVISWATKLTGKTKNQFDDQLVVLLERPIELLIVAVGFYSALKWLNLNQDLAHYLYLSYRLILIALITWAIGRSMSVVSHLMTQWTAQTESTLDDYIAPLVSRLLRITVYVVGALLMLQEFGVNVAGIIAGLGVGGLAFALAAQDTLANWFGALMIYTDQPFRVKDWIKTTQLEGVVEEIGLRSTRIRTFANTVVSVPNRQIANEVIENFSRMQKRRISYKIGVTYDTTPAMLEESVERIRDILRGHEEVDQSFWLVKFTEFGDSALEIFIYYFTKTTDWEEYLSIKQDVNLRIMQRLNSIGVQFAFPSMSIYQTNSDPEALSDLDAQARRLFAARIPQATDHRESRTAPSDDNADG